jgi:hypothetical protein
LNGLIEIKIMLACAKLYRLRFSICPAPLQIRCDMGCKLLGLMPQVPFDFRNRSAISVRLVLMLLVPDPGGRIHQLAVAIIVDWGTHDQSPIDVAPDASLALSDAPCGTSFLLIVPRSKRSCSAAQLHLAPLEALVFRPDNRHVRKVPKYFFWHFVCSKGGEEKRG